MVEIEAPPKLPIVDKRPPLTPLCAKPALMQVEVQPDLEIRAAKESDFRRKLRLEMDELKIAMNTLTISANDSPR